jgi:hypothetical protein
MNTLRSARFTYLASFFLGVLVALLLLAPARASELPCATVRPAGSTPG